MAERKKPLEFPSRYGWVVHGVPSFWRRLRVEGVELRAGDVLRFARTGEMVLVDRVARSRVDVVRGFQTSPCPVYPGDEVLLVGSVRSEAAVA